MEHFSPTKKKQKKPQIIHISGAPGSGKTTLGLKLAKRFGTTIVVKDTDDFHYKFDNNSTQNEGPKYLKYVGAEIQSFIKQHRKRPIVFVGILSVKVGNRTYMVKIRDATHLFFINVPDAVLLEQSYSRIVKIGKKDSSLWTDIALGKEHIPSSTEKLKEAKADLLMHKAAGYEIVARNDILKAIVNVLR